MSSTVKEEQILGLLILVNVVKMSLKTLKKNAKENKMPKCKACNHQADYDARAVVDGLQIMNYIEYYLFVLDQHCTCSEDKDYDEPNTQE